MARGNPYARGGDVMKTRSEKRKEKEAKLAKTNRVKRLKRRLGRIAAKKFAGQKDSHMTALMESYILRRKAERAAEKAAQEQSEAGTQSSVVDAEAMEAVESEEGSGSDAFSLSSGADDSAFDMDGDEPEDEDDDEDIPTSRQRAAEAKRRPSPQHPSRARGGRGGRGGGSGGGNVGRSWNAKKETTAAKRFDSREGRGGSCSFQRGRSAARGGQRAANQRVTNDRGYAQRSQKVPTRSLY
jgi:hypothetical protein